MTAEEREPIGIAGQRAETLRTRTRDYLLDAYKLTCGTSNSNLTTYYRVKINSLLRQEEVHQVAKNAEKSIICAKCGTLCSPKIKKLKHSKNIIEERCNRCKNSKSHKLQSRNHLLAKLPALNKKNARSKLIVEAPTAPSKLSSKSESKKKKPIKPTARPEFSSRLKLTCLLEKL